MNRKRKIPAILALLMSIVMIGTACNKTEIDSSVPNVTTTSAVTTVATLETTTPATESTTTTETVTAATTTAAATTTKAATTKAPVAATTKKVTTTTATTTTTPPPATITKIPPEPLPPLAGEDDEIIHVTNVTTAAAAKPPVSTSKHTLNKYVYNTLSAEEKIIYDELLNGIRSFVPRVEFSATHKAETVRKVFLNLYYQEPEIYWLSSTPAFPVGNEVKSMGMRYSKTQEQVAAMQVNLDKATNDIMAGMPAGASDVGKLKYLHDKIAFNSDATYEGPFVTTIYGALVDGKVQCEGYAKSMVYLANKAGFEATRVTGAKKDGASHAWAMVKVGGKWYNIDVSDDDPQGRADKNFIKHNYFMVPDSQIINLTHFVKDYYTPPVANSMDSNYFILYNLYAKTSAEGMTMFQNELTSAAKAKKPIIQVKFSNQQAYDDAFNQLYAKNKIKDQQTTANNASPNKITAINMAVDKNTLIIQANITY